MINLVFLIHVLPFVLSETFHTVKIQQNDPLNNSLKYKSLECDPICKTCETTSSHCTSCNDGYYLDETQNTCLNCFADLCKICDKNDPLICLECIDGYSPDILGHKCEKCPDECATCSYLPGYDYQTCITCSPGHYEVKFTSYVMCPTCNYDEDHQGCSKCIDRDDCEACMSNYYKSGNRCIKCDSNCATCKDSPTHCTGCQEGYYVDTSNTCQKCSDNCLRCNNVYSCLECKNGFYPAGTGCKSCVDNCEKCSNNNECDTCVAGFFKNDEGNCSKCLANCDQCNSTHCLDCAPEYYPLDDGSCGPCAPVCSECFGPTDKDCIKCDPGYYFSKSNRNCFKCNDACSTCNGPNNDDCSECNKGYFMKEKKCVKCENGCESCESYRKCNKCQNGFYLVDNNGDADCQPCSEGCMECENEKHTCTKCFPGYYESMGTSAMSCKPCSENCQSCNVQNKVEECTQCFDGYYFEENKCTLCQSPCLTCKSKTECTSCVNGFLLEGTSCDTPCSSECLSCNITSNNCITCHDGFILSGSSCIQCPDGCKVCEKHGSSSICLTCLDGYQKEGEKCEPCHKSCATCYSESYLACYTCAKGYFKYNVNTFPDLYTGECRRCDSMLDNCSICTSECLDDNLDNQEKCTFKCLGCSEGFYFYEEKCQPCHSSCNTCFGPLENHCTSCHDTFYLDGTNKCQQCDSSCENCYGSSTNCTSCPSGTYLDNNKCLTCKNNCDECLNESFCTKCSQSFYLFDGKCYQSCSEVGDHLIENTENYECECETGYFLNGTECELIPNGCDDHHCDIEENINGTSYINYTFTLPDVNGYHYEGNGGAVRAINVEFEANGSKLNSCYSVNGGGGAFFIYNTIESIESRGQINLYKVEFTNCKAHFGGAVYIYHVSNDSPIYIDQCKFVGNSLYDTSSRKLSGGSALYITAKNAVVSNCLFDKNKGKGGALKVSDDLTQKPDELSLVNDTLGSIVIEGCSFEIEESADCSLLFSSERQLMNVEIKECNFTGNLRKGAHYIDGQFANTQKPNLFISSCVFSSDERSSVNSKFIKIDSNNTFNKKKSSWSLTSAAAVAFVAVVVVTIVVVTLKRKNSNDDSESNSETRDTKDTSLI